MLTGLKTEVERTKPRGRPRKARWDGIKEDMKRFGLSREDAWSQKKDGKGKLTGIRLTQVHLEHVP